MSFPLSVHPFIIIIFIIIILEYRGLKTYTKTSGASISYSSLAGFKTGTLNLLTHFHSTLHI